MKRLQELEESIFKNNTGSKLNCIWNRITPSFFGGGVSLLTEDYSIQDIENFYYENKEILFKSGEELDYELKNNWSEKKFVNILDNIVIYADKKGISGVTDKLEKIFFNLRWNNVIKVGGEEDINYIIACEKLDASVRQVEADYYNSSNKEFFYKHILPNAILNDGKGQHYSTEELSHIADLRFEESEIPELLEEFLDYGDFHIREYSMEQIRKIRKRGLEIWYIIMFLADLDIDKRKKQILDDSMKQMLEAEYEKLINMEYGSFFRIMTAMVFGEDKAKIDYEAKLEIFYYIKYVIPCLKLLGELIGDKDLEKLEK